MVAVVEGLYFYWLVSSSAVGPGQLLARGRHLQHESSPQCLGLHHVVEHGVHQWTLGKILSQPTNTSNIC